MKIISYYFAVFIIIIFFSINPKYNISVNQFVMLSASEPFIVYLPLIISAWNSMGFGCIIVLIYKESTMKLKLVKKYILRKNNIVICLKLSDNEDIDIVSRLARIFSFINQPLSPYTLLMTADVDILPINKNYFRCKNPNNINIKSYGINGYGVFPANKRWAMSYIMMSLKNWIYILNNDLNKCNSIMTCVKIVTNDAYKRNISYYGGYYGRIDEVYMRDIIRNSSFFPHKISFTLHGSYSRKSFISLNKTPNKDIHLPRIKDYNEWIKYIYCLINNFNMIKGIKEYINNYCSLFNIHID